MSETKTPLNETKSAADIGPASSPSTAGKGQATIQGQTQTAHDYKDTLFLPQTAFAMRGGLPEAEPKWVAHWDSIGLYKQLRAAAKARGATPFILHDGPPYANGHIHLGTAMNKIVKDIVVRSHQMLGYDASYIPGWDCHGLPIEWKVEEAFRAEGRSKDSVSGKEFRAACRAYAQNWVEIQGREFRALGVEGEWDNPYLTMKFESEAVTVAEFLRVAMQGLLVRGAKPIMWSPVERTALAEAEIEYADRKVPMIWVRFPIQAGASGTLVEGASVLIWTTTPWTLPANQAVSYNRDIAYGVYGIEAVMSEAELGFAPYARAAERLVLADALAETVMATGKVSAFKRLGDADPQGWTLSHPLHAWDSYFAHKVPMLAGDHVTDTAGTGFVHTAPAHGEDDFNVWVESGFTSQDIRQIVDADGCYTGEVPEALRGLDIIVTSGKKRGEAGRANGEVMRLLAEAGGLFARGLTTIRDAHSWRSKAPVIRRATPQWFIAMDRPGLGGLSGQTLRQSALAAIAQTQFFPPTGRNRLEAMVAGRPDWLISRQRNWGVPITIFVNKASGQPHTSHLPKMEAEALNARIKAAIEAGGVEAWFDTPISEFLSPLGLDPADWDKVTDVLDVWFDSGTTHAFTLRARGVIEAETGQADLYLEGSDQHRGWFQSSLLEGCATRGIAPFKQILTHGFIVDADGKKMSKSLGNTVEPQTVAKQYGIEILRIWAASSDFTEDLRISDEILKGVGETYRKLRNTFRYLLGALAGYDPEAEAIDRAQMQGLERYMLHRLAELSGEIEAAYCVYDYKKIMSLLINFCGVELSAVYFDIRKDSLYCDAPSDLRRRGVRTVMAAILERLLVWLAPIMPFTTEEAFQASLFAGQAQSVHLRLFPPVPADWHDEALAARWELIFRVRRVVTGALELERRDKRIGSSLEAAPKVYLAQASHLAAFDGEEAADIFITSQAQLLAGEGPEGAFALPEEPGIHVLPDRATGIKCGRSWKYFDSSLADPEFPDITPRDAAAVREIRANRGTLS